MNYLKSNTGKCTKCGIFASVLTVIVDPNKPRLAKKRDYVIDYLCERCDK